MAEAGVGIRPFFNPMMLLTNRPVKSKNDTLRVVRMFFMRWRIEDYFRFKKQRLALRTSSSLGLVGPRLSGLAIGFLCVQPEKRRTCKLWASLMEQANGQRQESKIAFILYRVALAGTCILPKVKTGNRAWFRIGKPKCHQLSRFAR